VSNDLLDQVDHCLPPGLVVCWRCSLVLDEVPHSQAHDMASNYGWYCWFLLIVNQGVENWVGDGNTGGWVIKITE